jgi:magnesium transporter
MNVLHKGHPADVAQVLHGLSDLDRYAVFAALSQNDRQLAAQSLSELGVEEGVELLDTLPPLARVWNCRPTTRLFMAKLPEGFASDYSTPGRSRPRPMSRSCSPGTAGRIMTPDVFVLSDQLTAGEAISAIQRASSDVEMVFYLYVTDDRNHLVGVVSLRKLLLVPPTTPLKKIMSTELISVRTDTEQGDVARLVANYNLLGVPVVDAENKLVGVVTVDDVIDVIRGY